MFKFVATFFLVTSLVHSVPVLSSDLNVRLLSTKRKEITSGTTSNVLVTFTNTSENSREFDVRLKMPDQSWRQFMDYSSVTIDGNTTMNKIISIHVPEYIRSGEYSIVLEAIDKSDNQIFGSIPIPVFVKPRYGITIEKLKTKKYLFSGDTLSVKFLIRNLSNLDVNVKTGISNGYDNVSGTVKIPKDSAVAVGTLVTTVKNMNYFTQQNVNVSAVVEDRPETNTFSSYLLDIFPTDNVKFDGFNRYPVAISTILAYSNRWQNQNYAFMYDIKGSGLINHELKNKLEFRFRGPDHRGNPILGLSDEYYMNYKSTHIELQVGDNNYRLSELTESSRYGRGAKIQYNLKDFTIAAFYHFPRFYPEIKKSYAVYTGFKFNDHFRILSGYLAKIDLMNNRADLFTLSGNFRPFSFMNSSFEVSMGRKNDFMTKAYKGNLTLSSSKINAHFNYIYADKLFPGFISNALVISSGFTANVSKRLSFSANYDRNGSKMALDTLYANAPFSENLNLTTNIKLKRNNSLGLSAHSVGLEDQSPIPLFHYKKYFGRLYLYNKLGNFSSNFQGEIGKINNFLVVESGNLTDFYNGMLSLKQEITDKFTLSAFLNYQGGKQYMITGFSRYYYGGSIMFNSRKNTFLSIDYQSDYELKEYYRDRSLFSVQFHQELFDNHSLELSANYNMMKNSLDKKELSVQLRYTYTLNAPVSRKKDVGSLAGKVINKGVESVEGIILNLNGNITVTDKNGNFKFPAIKVGEYVLMMDESSFAINTITGQPGPFHVKIEPGRELAFNIELTKATGVEGKLIVIEDKNVDKNKYFPLKVDIDRLVVEASNEKEIFRIYTSRDGTFNFNDLRPGTWNIKLYKNNLPGGYVMEKDQFTLTLESGKIEKLDVKVLKKNREIKLQKKF